MEESLEAAHSIAWYALLSPREQATIDHARAYAREYSAAGVPGHSQHLLIAKLAKLLDDRELPSDPLFTMGSK